MLTKLGIIGYGGKLGKEIVRLAERDAIHVSLKASKNEWSNEITPQVLINVSHKDAVEKAVAFCFDNKIPLIEGTSGLSENDSRLLKQLADTVPVMRAENFSFGNFIQKELLKKTAQLLLKASVKYETGVIDRHTTSKLDSPSATAHALAETWQQATGKQVNTISSVRAGLPVSDHTVNLIFEGEELCLFHSVRERTAAANGALLAAHWILNKPAALWTMTDVYSS